MLRRRKKKPTISPEKIARIAEKGLRAVRLSKSEKIELARSGINEIYAVKDGLKGEMLQIDERIIDTVLDKYFPVLQNASTPRPLDMILRLTDQALEIIKNATEWKPASPAFAIRGPESGNISFFKEAGKFTVHLEVVRTDARRVSLNVRLTDETKRDRSSFEAAIFCDDRCIESLSVSQNPVASFSNISLGDYRLQISDKKGEITTLDIRMEQ